MNIFESSVTVLLFVAFGSLTLSAQTKSLNVPVEVQFLNRGNEPIEGPFTIRSGQILVSDGAGNETQSPLGRLDGSKGVMFTGTVDTILGAPAVVFARQEVALPPEFNNANSTLRAVVRPDATLFVQETRALSPVIAKQVITEFIVSQQTNGNIAELGRFSFHENIFNQYLSEVWPISDAVLAIITRSSKHSKLNTLFMFDVKARQLVGMREFSMLQYIPATSSVWIVQSVANCDNIDEVFAEAKRNAQVFQLFESGEVSRDFQTLDGIEGAVAGKTKSGLTDTFPPCASLPQVNRQSLNKVSETNPSHAPSEEPTSSKLLSIIAVLIVVALGLPWLLLKRRS